MDEPAPSQRGWPHIGVLVALVLIAVGWLLMLQIALRLEGIQEADGEPLRNFNPEYLIAPRIGLALTAVIAIWSFFDRRGSFPFALALLLMVLAVLGYGLGVYVLMWPIAAIWGR